MITTDKGLCGALNTNLLRLVLAQYKQWQAEGEEIEVCALGNKGLGFMQRLGANDRVARDSARRPAADGKADRRGESDAGRLHLETGSTG